tara:strand:+ start:6755 stop:8308 length:1554 start_codon:yes stop_codon:yes gene_type:complete
LEVWAQGQNPELSLIDRVELDLPDTFDDLLAMLQTQKAAPPRGQLDEVNHFWIARPMIRHGEDPLHQRVNIDSLKQWFDNNDIRQIRQILVRTFTLRLDGRTRFDLVEPKETGPLEEYPKNHLWALFANDDGREKVREFTEEAFGKHFVIDPTGMNQFRVRLSGRKPKTKNEEQALDDRARKFHQKAELVSELGDGVRTSVGLVSAVMSLPHRILLIDEPEAFLHPTLARRVGRVLAQSAREREATLVVATHSADFLMGCIQSAPKLRLIRLTYTDQKATARSIDPSEIVNLMNDPLLRSANALRALFHRGVVVTEADADRAFYEEVNHRLLHDDMGIEDSLFMNAQNWQTIPRIANPLRHLGIPAAAVFDFDVLMDNDFKCVWPLLHLKKGAKLTALQSERADVKALMDKKGRLACKKSGLSAFKGAEKAKIENFIESMRKFGIFFVPVGELECWLASLGIPKINDKPKWLASIFTAMGSDPTDPGYLSAGADDVWSFINSIESWVNDPKRQGIPS